MERFVVKTRSIESLLNHHRDVREGDNGARLVTIERDGSESIPKLIERESSISGVSIYSTSAKPTEDMSFVKIVNVTHLDDFAQLIFGDNDVPKYRTFQWKLKMVEKRAKRRAMKENKKAG
jgi:hypothetical protein